MRLCVCVSTCGLCSGHTFPTSIIATTKRVSRKGLLSRTKALSYCLTGSIFNYLYLFYCDSYPAVCFYRECCTWVLGDIAWCGISLVHCFFFFLCKCETTMCWNASKNANAALSALIEHQVNFVVWAYDWKQSFVHSDIKWFPVQCKAKILKLEVCTAVPFYWDFNTI